MLNVIMLNAVMLNVVRQSVVAPFFSILRLVYIGYIYLAKNGNDYSLQWHHILLYKMSSKSLRINNCTKNITPRAYQIY